MSGDVPHVSPRSVTFPVNRGFYSRPRSLWNSCHGPRCQREYGRLPYFSELKGNAGDDEEAAAACISAVRTHIPSLSGWQGAAALLLSLWCSLSRCRLHFAEVFHSQHIVSRALSSGCSRVGEGGEGEGGVYVYVAVQRSHFLPFIECCPSAWILALGQLKNAFACFKCHSLAGRVSPRCLLTSACRQNICVPQESGESRPNPWGTSPV